MAYTTALLVDAHLGGSLTSELLVRAHALIPTAEAFVNERCGRAFGLGVQTNEAHYQPFRNDLYLRVVPVTSVASIAGRPGFGADEETFTVGEDYEVRDLPTGRLWLWSPGSWDRVRVTYTPDSAIPASIQLATTELVALALQAALAPESYGLRRYRLPDLEVEYAREVVAQVATPAILDRLNAWIEAGVA